MLIPLKDLNDYLAKSNPFLAARGSLRIPAEVGFDAAEMLGITKFVAPEIESADTVANPAGFDNHTDIQSLQTFASVIPEGMEVVVTEKIHGVAVKAGWSHEGEFLLGTNNATVKPDAVNAYTEVATALDLAEKLRAYPGYTIYGEIFGPGIQKKMHYGLKTKTAMFYGVSVNGEFMRYDERVAFIKSLGLTPVPLLARGPFTPAMLELCDGQCYSGAHIREGIVVTSAEEEFNDQVGRVILKLVSPQFQLKNYDEAEVR